MANNKDGDTVELCSAIQKGNGGLMESRRCPMVYPVR